MGTKSTERKIRRIRSISSMFFVLLIIGVSAYSLFNNEETSLGFAESAEAGIPAWFDELWVLICASLVFFMQAGFLCYEVGLARPVHATTVAIKNMVDWTISSVGFFVLGFGFMFGEATGTFFGTNLFLLDGIGSVETSVSGITFFIFQLAFAGTAITLVSGSLVERTTLFAYSAIAVALALVIYPIFGHWVWGNALYEGNSPWLASFGFHDFAGGTVVHLLGATVAMVGIVMVGPRIGRFKPNGEVNDMPASNMGLTLLGVLILWFGWWGFNGGSYIGFEGNVAVTILVTNMAAVAGLVGAGLTAALFQKRYSLNLKLVGGAVGGLVAITPGADIVTPVGAIATGLLAGVVFSFSNDLLLRMKIDDALSVIPVHGFCAAFGTLSLAFFGADGSFDSNSRMEQFVVQFVGVVACVLWATVTSFPIYWLVRKFVGLRISPMDEMSGIAFENTVWPYGESVEEPAEKTSKKPGSAILEHAE